MEPKEEKSPWEDPCLRGREVNIVILFEMEKCGITSVVELSERSGIPYEVLFNLVTMEVPFYNEKEKRWEKAAIELADFFGSFPGDFFGEENRERILQEIQESVDIFSVGGTQRSPEEIVQERERLGVLSEKEKDILEKRLGLKGGRGMTLKKVGETRGISSQRVKYIEERALSKLKYPCHLRAISRRKK